MSLSLGAHLLTLSVNRIFLVYPVDISISWIYYLDMFIVGSIHG